ncbi:glycosyltransferase involved in cell wall biosynthesis [Pseudorhizobium tarimense]|uniref:Glycosyltransferase involved in cell wall biosynthesis n=1 Tax=Pseudorhizobium tarimense TaxID=1079109 RepID=A0ABV2H4N5_9HYPH|nr:glycosyltransferase family 4 protein [Pseudorhizobium tarimense]MCJ8518606.1 glycosyltransferase family 4 protein [Pseudorhizobium tarimense]
MSVSHADQFGCGTKLRVFVHLAENKDALRWKAAWDAGTLVGVNDETPYGYGRANAFGCAVSFSKSSRERWTGKLLRYGARLILGFDILHAWHQRHEFENADVIWTHTESQYLAVAGVVRLTGIKTKIIGQTVWLFDHWSKLSLPKRYLYAYLIKRVDVLTFLSTGNMQVADRLFPDTDLRLVPFGIPAEAKVPPRMRDQAPFRILAIGNDRHRDWPALLEAVRSQSDLLVTILSGTIPKRLFQDIPNVEVRSAQSAEELRNAFEAANVACIPLQPNLHASGITAIQEAVLAGVPVVASDTGGLRHYFSDSEVHYVPPSDPAALLQALLDIRHRPDDARQMAVKAQARMGSGGLSASDYILSHVRISRDILCERTEPLALTEAVQPVDKIA